MVPILLRAKAFSKIMAMDAKDWMANRKKQIGAIFIVCETIIPRPTY
jgi:hypothetical protein